MEVCRASQGQVLVGEVGLEQRRGVLFGGCVPGVHQGASDRSSVAGTVGGVEVVVCLIYHL